MSNLEQAVNGIASALVNGTAIRREHSVTVVEAYHGMFLRGDDIRVDDDSVKNLLTSMRSYLGPARPYDDEPEEQWVWDKLTALVVSLYGPDAFDSNTAV